MCSPRRSTLRPCATSCAESRMAAFAVWRGYAGSLSFSHEILNAESLRLSRCAPLEDARARAVEMRRRAPGNRCSKKVGGLDPAPSRRWQAEAWPDCGMPDERASVATLVAVPEGSGQVVSDRVAGQRFSVLSFGLQERFLSSQFSFSEKSDNFCVAADFSSDWSPRGARSLLKLLRAEILGRAERIECFRGNASRTENGALPVSRCERQTPNEYSTDRQPVSTPKF